MTIGPEPRIRIFEMSLRRGNALEEAIEQVQAVVWTGSGLGVVLHRAAGNVEQLEPLNRAVIQIDVRQCRGAEVRLPADRLVALDRARAVWADGGEAVILGGDLHPPGLQVLDRM